MRPIFAFILVLFLVQCKPKSDLVFNAEMLSTIPDSIIAPDVMANMLTDIHLAEAAVQEVQVDSIQKDRTKLIATYYADIFALYNMEYDKFKRSYLYYSDHPLLMNYIYKEVTNNLSLLESKKQIQ